MVTAHQADGVSKVESEKTELCWCLGAEAFRDQGVTLSSSMIRLEKIGAKLAGDGSCSSLSVSGNKPLVNSLCNK